MVTCRINGKRVNFVKGNHMWHVSYVTNAGKKINHMHLDLHVLFAAVVSGV